MPELRNSSVATRLRMGYDGHTPEEKLPNDLTASRFHRLAMRGSEVVE